MKLIEPTIFRQIDGFSCVEEQGELFKSLLPRVAQSSPISIVEVGVYKGRMTAMIAEMLSEAGVGAEYYCVDTFFGSAEHERKDYFPEFRRTLDIIDYLQNVRIMTITEASVEAAKGFREKSIDIVYLNASRDYDSVMADIEAWRGVVRAGGFLCGDDYIDGRPGVMKAVNECFLKGKIIRIASQQWAVQL